MKSQKTSINLLENTRRYKMTKKGVLTTAYHKQKERSIKYGREMPTYTLREFHDKFLNDKKFDRIYRAWIKNGKKYYDKPSFDRIDPNVGYTMDNIQVMTWKQNRRKGDYENSLRTTQVKMMDMDGKEIKIFPSIKEAVIYSGLNQGLISLCCQGKRNHTGGYKWEYGSHFRTCIKDIHANPELLKEDHV